MAAELAQLVGWMAYDGEQHGLAQRYLIQALGLSRLAGDDGLGAEILAAMSQQAVYVARPGQAVDLARVAQAAARKAGPWCCWRNVTWPRRMATPRVTTRGPARGRWLTPSGPSSGGAGR